MRRIGTLEDGSVARRFCDYLLTLEIDAAVDVLRAGGLIGLPTETVYGLGADAANEAAVQRIFLTKGRPAGHPLIVHLGSAAQLGEWAEQGKLRWREELVEGLEEAPHALNMLFTGDNIGKLVVRVGYDHREV